MGIYLHYFSYGALHFILTYFHQITCESLILIVIVLPLTTQQVFSEVSYTVLSCKAKCKPGNPHLSAFLCFAQEHQLIFYLCVFSEELQKEVDANMTAT